MIKTETPAPTPPTPPAPPAPAKAAPVKIVKQKKAAPKEASIKELRDFGLLVGGIFLALGLLALHRGKMTGPYFTPIGAVLMVLGLAAPSALRGVHKAWMGLAEVMGKFMTGVILRLFYFLYMTPAAAVMRMLGKDPLDLRLDKQATSYWQMRPNAKPGDATHFTNQF